MSLILYVVRISNIEGKFNATYSKKCIRMGNAYINGICASTLYWVCWVLELGFVL